MTKDGISRTQKSYTQPENVTVRNYYGPGTFQNTESGSGSEVKGKEEGEDFMLGPFDGLMHDAMAVWLADTVNPVVSYQSSFDEESSRPSQSCTAYRVLQDATNFTLKQGQELKMIQGYKIIDGKTKKVKYEGESQVMNIKLQTFNKAENNIQLLLGMSSIVVGILAISF